MESFLVLLLVPSPVFAMVLIFGIIARILKSEFLSFFWKSILNIVAIVGISYLVGYFFGPSMAPSTSPEDRGIGVLLWIYLFLFFIIFAVSSLSFLLCGWAHSESLREKKITIFLGEICQLFYGSFLIFNLYAGFAVFIEKPHTAKLFIISIVAIIFYWLLKFICHKKMSDRINALKWEVGASLLLFIAFCCYYYVLLARPT